MRGRRGENVVALDGRVSEGRLRPGTFRVEVVDTTGRGERMLGRLAVSIRYDAKGRAQVRQVPLAALPCLGGAVFATSLLVGEQATMPAAGGGDGAAGGPGQGAGKAGTVPPAGGSDEPEAAGDDESDGGGLAALPNLGPDDAVGGLTAWILLTLLLLAAGGFLLVAGSSAVRASCVAESPLARRENLTQPLRTAR